MSDTNTTWEQIARDIQADFEKADSNYAPPDGKYTVLLESMNIGTYKDQATNKVLLRVQPRFQILEGNLAGLAFNGDRYTNKTPNALGILRSALEKLLGEISGNLHADLKAAQALEGNLVAEVEVKRKVTERGEFTNVRILRVLEVQPA